MTEDARLDTNPSQSSTSRLFWVIFIKTTLLSFVIVFVMLLLTVIGAALIVNSKISTFERLTNTNRNELLETVKLGWRTEPQSTDGRITVLVLGTDSLVNRGTTLPLTDTMMLASINLDTGTIQLVPLPRDLWSEEYKTKINALYAYGFERYPSKPEQFPQEVIEQMTAIDIHHTVVISMEDLATLIDSVGGLSIDVPTAFVDTEFPRTDVDVTVERDPAKLYKTISFETGTQEMNGERALEYIRSRHSSDAEGSDTARSERQQLVIQALIKKLVSKQTLKNVENLADLYLFYDDTFAQYISLSEAVSIGKKLIPFRSSLVFKSENISIYPDDSQGAIFHPPLNQSANQWVFKIRDQQLLQKELKMELLQKE